jgi:hypothetical protein
MLLDFLAKFNFSIEIVLELFDHQPANALLAEGVTGLAIKATYLFGRIIWLVLLPPFVSIVILSRTNNIGLLIGILQILFKLFLLWICRIHRWKLCSLARC